MKPEEVRVNDHYDFKSPENTLVEVRVITGDEERDEWKIKDVETGREWTVSSEDLEYINTRP